MVKRIWQTKSRPSASASTRQARRPATACPPPSSPASRTYSGKTPIHPASKKRTSQPSWECASLPHPCHPRLGSKRSQGLQDHHDLVPEQAADVEAERQVGRQLETHEGRLLLAHRVFSVAQCDTSVRGIGRVCASQGPRRDHVHDQASL